MSKLQLTMHHTKHHQAYVNGGHVLHSLFWENLAPAGKGGWSTGGALEDAINGEFGGFERFRKEFS